MTQHDSKSSIHIDTIERLVRVEQHQKTDALSLVNRRAFLMTGALGVTGLTLSPLQKLMAMQTQEDCERILRLLPSKPRKGFWDTLIRFLLNIFSALGYGKLIGTGLELVRRLTQKASDTNLLSQGLQQRVNRLVTKGYQYYNETQWPTGDVGQFNYFNLARLEHCKKFFLPALKSDKLNGITSFYNSAISLEHPTTELVGPSMYFHNEFTRIARELGYADEIALIRASYPKEQKEESGGSYQANYSNQDKFITDDGATVALGYNRIPGQQKGTLYIDIAKIRDMNTGKLKSAQYKTDFPWSS